MDTSFDELKAITDSIYGGNSPTREEFHNSVIQLLAKYGIKIRQRDGSNPQVTISHPTSLPGTMVVGLRYTKLDGTKTEDHFLFQEGHEIGRYYGKSLERLLREYRGAHKLQR